MKKKRTRPIQEAKPHPRRRSARANVERMLGKKLLSGEIPVVPPGELHRCPVPTSHPDHDSLCRDFEDGKLNYTDVLEKVGEAIKKPEPKIEEGHTDATTT